MARRPKVERAYELAKEIFQLEKLLAAKRGEFERLVGDTPQQLTLPLRPRESYPTRLRAILADAGQRDVGFHEIVAKLGEDGNADTARATLSKMISANEIARVGPGLYRAVPNATAEQKLAKKSSA